MPTGIEWTEETWNPVRARKLEGAAVVGWHCTHASDGCKFCYAEAINRRLGTGLDYKPGHESRISIFLDEKALNKPLHWKRPRMIFPGSMTDLFADFVTDAMLVRIFAVCALTPQHTYQFLTKRPERMLAFLSDPGTLTRIATAMCAWPGGAAASMKLRLPLPNVWLGVSVEDHRVRERIDVLREIPAAVRWISFEPLIGHIYDLDLTGMDWAVVGGESGSRARFAEGFEAAALEIRVRCLMYGVAYFLKQMTFKKPIPPHMMLREMPA